MAPGSVVQILQSILSPKQCIKKIVLQKSIQDKDHIRSDYKIFDWSSFAFRKKWSTKTMLPRSIHSPEALAFLRILYQITDNWPHISPYFQHLINHFQCQGFFRVLLLFVLLLDELDFCQEKNPLTTTVFPQSTEYWGRVKIIRTDFDFFVFPRILFLGGFSL